VDLDPLAIVRRRLHEQRLTGTPFATAAAAVAFSGAVQAQEYAEALWALAMRTRDHDAAAVAAASDRGEILRTHVLRPTWHFVAAADLGWMLRLTGRRIIDKDAGRMRSLGLDAGTLAAIHEALAVTLADGDPRTRAELATALRAAGIDTSGQRIAHAVMHAELSGVLCSGPRRGAHHTYVPFDSVVGPAPDRSRADDVAALVLRYFESHGPATLRDFAWWSGLTIADGKAGVVAAGERLAATSDEHGRTWFAAASASAGAPPARCGAHLLGTYDETLVAYRDLRTVDADGSPAAVLHQRAVVVDGRFAGTWKRRLTRSEVVVELALRAPPDGAQQRALRAAADRYGAFAGLPARLELV
jgi:hypothetical protein